MTTVTAIKCPECRDIVYSRAHHDFRSCGCGGTSIDGGPHYTRVLGNPPPQTFILEVPMTPEELHHDWNWSLDQYGRLSSGAIPTTAFVSIVAFYTKARGHFPDVQNLQELADRFGVCPLTVQKWAKGVSRPRPSVEREVVKYLETKRPVPVPKEHQ